MFLYVDIILNVVVLQMIPDSWTVFFLLSAPILTSKWQVFYTEPQDLSFQPFCHSLFVLYLYLIIFLIVIKY